MNPFFHTGLPLDATLTNLSPGFTYHCRAFASNELGAASSPDLAVSLPLLKRPGDLNGDGVVDQRDLDILLANLNNSGLDQNTLNLVLSNYWPHSPWLNMTNVAAWGGGRFPIRPDQRRRVEFHRVGVHQPGGLGTPGRPGLARVAIHRPRRHELWAALLPPEVALMASRGADWWESRTPTRSGSSCSRPSCRP